MSYFLAWVSNLGLHINQIPEDLDIPNLLKDNNYVTRRGNHTNPFSKLSFWHLSHNRLDYESTKIIEDIIAPIIGLERHSYIISSEVNFWILEAKDAKSAYYKAEFLKAISDAEVAIAKLDDFYYDFKDDLEIVNYNLKNKF